MFKPPFKQIAQASPNARATLIMQQISYWAPKARLKRDGFTWVVKSRQDLMHECGLTLGQVNRALRSIKDTGVLVIERHRFHADIHLWIRFPEREIWKSKVMKTTLCEVPETVLGEVPKSYQPLPEDYNQGSTTNGVQSCGEETEDQDVVKYGGKLADKISDLENQQTKSASAEQLQEVFDKTIGNPTTSNLVQVWTSAWIHYGWGFCPKPSQKDQASLKNLAKELGPDVASALIVESLGAWKKFSESVSTQAGFSGKAPSTPAVWFLFTHRALALAWLSQTVKASPEGSSGASATIENEDLWGKLD